MNDGELHISLCLCESIISTRIKFITWFTRISFLSIEILVHCWLQQWTKISSCSNVKLSLWGWPLVPNTLLVIKRLKILYDLISSRTAFGHKSNRWYIFLLKTLSDLLITPHRDFLVSQTLDNCILRGFENFISPGCLILIKLIVYMNNV